MMRLLGGPGWRPEAVRIIHLAVPLGLAQLAQMAMGVTDTVMMGHLSAQSLAAGGQVASLTWMVLVVAQGLVQSLQPLVAHARGAGDPGPLGRLLGAALVISAILSVPVVFYVLDLDRLLLAIAQPPETARLARTYAIALAWGVPAAIVQAVLRNYLSAWGHTGVVMTTVIAAAILNLLLNWLLIFGHWGLPRLDLYGAGLATAISWWLMTLVFAGYIGVAGLYPADLLRVPVRALLRGGGELIHLGWPIAAGWATESGMFGGSTLIAGRFGSAALAAHQICVNVSALTFMVPLAIGNAATIRVGYQIGAGNPTGARQAGFVALALTVLIELCQSIGIFMLARPVLAAYLGGADPEVPAVMALGGTMLRIAAFFQLFDGLQTVAAGALRGLKETRVAFLAALVGYWGLGMPVALLLAFPLGLGAIGIWWAFLLSLGVVAVLLTWRFRVRADHAVAVGGLA